MENDVGIPTTLFGGPPELGNTIKLGNSQNSFMNIFARPLFEAVTDILPAMVFAVDEMKINQGIWTEKVKEESAKEDAKSPNSRKFSEALLSPRSGSPNHSASQPELSHPEGLPASNSPPIAYRPLESSLNLQFAESGKEVRRDSASSVPYHHGPGDSTYDSSRRSSFGHPFGNISSNPDSASYSRRSSGALSTSNNSHPTVTARRSSNTSPSQLQLGRSHQSRSQRASSVTASENMQHHGRASEDTLSQSAFTNTSAPPDEHRCRSDGNSSGSDTVQQGSKGDDAENPRFNRFSANELVGRPPSHSNHHRSSSGAHTNKTNMSQSTPYSPTGTQATSILTVDSDEKSSQGRVNSLNYPDRKAIPDVVNLERPGSGHHYNSITGLDGAKEVDIKTSVMANGNVREGSTQRLVGRKSSRFNFNFWKKKGKGVEASP